MRLAFIIAIPLLLIPFGQPTGEAAPNVHIGKSPIDTMTVNITAGHSPIQVEKVQNTIHHSKALRKIVQVGKSEIRTKHAAKESEKSTTPDLSSKKTNTYQVAAKQSSNNPKPNPASENQNTAPEKQDTVPNNTYPTPASKEDSSNEETDVLYGITHIVKAEQIKQGLDSLITR
ncbi:hypothetical protein MK805_14595 [Shimazuella sp. AN120528]|uniref:hypothetical protein n=1 Tax=Shimazuella soli TaxID=1892854 RepID=UPI001F118E77|nr:hypothetical protein [Shimazuella soli]MCH5586168.1 hypothetical protein [Shimazuella soli]